MLTLSLPTITTNNSNNACPSVMTLGFLYAWPIHSDSVPNNCSWPSPHSCFLHTISHSYSGPRTFLPSSLLRNLTHPHRTRILPPPRLPPAQPHTLLCFNLPCCHLNIIVSSCPLRGMTRAVHLFPLSSFLTSLLPIFMTTTAVLFLFLQL